MIYISFSATKGGFKEIYPTQKALPGISRDIRAVSGSAYAVGQEAYAISFLDTGLICTKCKIIRDVLAGIRVGNISISLFLPISEKLSGEEIKTLLDKLMDFYCREYIDIDNNLGDVYENWGFVDAISSQYISKPNPHSEDAKGYQSGTVDAAFFYYTTDEELQKHFDSPYQEEYRDGNYRQIFFVKSYLNGTDQNPLNALRHNPASNLTGKIDLENPPFKLKEFHETGKNGLNIEIWANDRKRFNKDVIKRNDNVKIKYSKNKYFEDKNEEGKLYDENIRQYLYIDEYNKKISVKNDLELDPKTQTITLDVKDRNGKTFDDAEITYYGNYQQERKISGNKITFSGEERKEKWTITAKKENLIAQPVSFTPESQIGDVRLVLEKHLLVKIIATDDSNGGFIYNIKIRINGPKQQPKDNIIEFIGDEINKNWNVSILHNDYETDSFDFYPDTVENPKSVPLKKRTWEKQKSYAVAAGGHGKFRNSYNYYSNSRSGADLQSDIIIADKGWEFIGYTLNSEKKNGRDGTFVAQYKKKIPFFRKPAFIAVVIVMLIIISIGLYLDVFTAKSDPPETQAANPQEITQYIDGIELYEEKLNNYKKDYCKNNATTTKAMEKSILQKFFLFGSNDDEPKEASTPDYCSKMDNAINIRQAINSGKIDALQDMQYSPAQNSFKTAVNNIDGEFKTKTGEVMNKDTVSKMNLDEIANFINDLQKLLRIRSEVVGLSIIEDFESLIEEVERINFPVDSIVKNIKKEIESKKPQNKSKKGSKSGNNSGKEKKPESERKKEENAQSQVNSSNYSNTLETEFWHLVNSGSTTKQSYKDLLNKYKSQGGDYIKYLNKICKNSDSFKKFTDIEARDRIVAKKLPEIDKN